MRRILFFCFGVALISSMSMMPSTVSAAYKLELPSDDFGWIKVETTNFTVFSNADEMIARKTAVSLEYLRAVLVQQFDEIPSVSPVPTYVFVFDYFSDAYPPYGPFLKGKPRKSGGYFINRPLANYVAIVERDYRFPDRMGILHDYLHSVLNASGPDLPLWLEEGLAEYYSVFHIKEGKAHIGYRVNRHIAWLRNKPLMPLAELLAVDKDSPVYNEEDRTGILFAESWLLTHMLLTERPDGRAQAALYSELIREGYDRDRAFVEAFKTTYEELEADLKKYVRSRSHHYTVLPLKSSVVNSIAVSQMPRSEVLFRLGDLLSSGRSERHDFAAEHFEAALVLDEGYGPAVAGLGFLDEAAGRREGARALYERAAKLSPDDYRINLLLGRSLSDWFESEASQEARTAQLERARMFLRRATELRPGLIEAWAEFGATYLADTQNTDPGIDALEHAMEIQPKHPGVGINLTALYVNKGSAMKAQSVIVRMEAAGLDTDALHAAQEIAARLIPEPEVG